MIVPVNTACPTMLSHAFTDIMVEPFGHRKLRLCERCGVLEAAWDKGADRRIAYYVPFFPAETHPEGK